MRPSGVSKPQERFQQLMDKGKQWILAAILVVVEFSELVSVTRPSCASVWDYAPLPFLCTRSEPANLAREARFIPTYRAVLLMAALERGR